MTGYAFVLGGCFGCGRMFAFSPVRVPSISIAGERRPVCQVCVDRVNPMRRKNGLPEIVPLAGAYEPCSEDELQAETGTASYTPNREGV